MDAIVGIAFSPGPHVSSSKLLWEVGNPFEGGNGGEERNTRKLCVILHLCRGGGSWGVLGRELPVGLLGRAGVVSAGRPYPGRGGRNTEYELAIPSMPSAISEGIVHATLAQRSRLTRAAVGRTIFLRTEAVPCSPAGIFDRIPRLALPPGGGVCCTSCCIATMSCLGLTGAHCTSTQRRTIPEIDRWCHGPQSLFNKRGNQL